jgi:hypothetical protein
MGEDKYIKTILEFISYCEKFGKGKKLKDENTEKVEKVEIKLIENLNVPGFDESKESTQIQIVLLNGEKIKAKFNFDQKVSDIYNFVSLSTSIEKFLLVVSGINQELTSLDKTIDECNLKSVQLIQKKE